MELFIVAFRATLGGRVAGLALVAACADSNRPHPQGEGGALGCTPGTEIDCYCDTGEARMQLCEPGGRAYEPCPCPDAATGGDTSARRNDAGEGAPPDDAPPRCPELADSVSCKAAAYESDRLPARIVFVIDRSGSMNCNPPPLQESAACEATPEPVDAAAPSKWSIVANSLPTALQGLVGTGTKAGLILFNVDDECGATSTPTVELSPIDDALVVRVHDSLAATTPSGATPIVGATILGYKYLHQIAHADGNRYVVVLTDGANTCPRDPAENAAAIAQLLDVEVGKALGVDMRTFVIGAPGSEGARGLLSELAFRGGTAPVGGCSHPGIDGDVGDCHFDMSGSTDFGADLAAALREIQGSALGCEFEVPSGGDPTHGINVQYTQGGGPVATCFPYDQDADCEGGGSFWQHPLRPDGSLDTSKVQICGDACAMIGADAVARVDVILGCPPIG